MSFNPSRITAELIVERDALFADYVDSRGITVEQALHHGLVPTFDEHAPSVLIVRKHYETRTKDGLLPLPGFVIDYGDGYVTFRYLCDESEMPSADGKPMKLIAPVGKGRIFIPRGLALEDLPDGTLISAAESAVKAIVMTCQGKPAVGLNGVRGAFTGGKLQPSFIKIMERFTPVITFDANAHNCRSGVTNLDCVDAQRKTARALYEQGHKQVLIRVVPPYRYGDQGIDDYVGRGGDIDDLEVYIADEDGGRPLEVEDASELFDRKFAPRDPIIDGLIARGESLSMMAEAKTGKTMSILTGICQLATGGTFIGAPQFIIPRPMKVIALIFEDKEEDIQAKLARFCEHRDIPLSELKGNVKFIYARHVEPGSDILVKLSGIIRRGFKADVVIIDTIAKLNELETPALIRASRSQVTDAEYQKKSRFTRWCRDENVAIILLEHPRKNAGSGSVLANAGNSTGTAAGAVDNLARLAKFPEKANLPTNLRHFATNSRTSEDIHIVVEISVNGVHYTGEYAMFQATTEEDAVMNAIVTRCKGLTAASEAVVHGADLATLTGKTESTVKNQCAALVNKGLLASKKGPGGGYTLTELGWKAVELRSKY